MVKIDSTQVLELSAIQDSASAEQYKIQQVQELHECDLFSCKNFCHKFVSCVDEDKVQNLLMSDEDNFHLARSKNKQIYSMANNNTTKWIKTITV